MRAWFDRASRSAKRKTWRSFASLFPKIAFEINALKSASYQPTNPRYKPYAVFSHFLEMIESEHVFHLACKKLLDANIPFITIHDSFVVKRSQQEKAKKIIVGAFMGGRSYYYKLGLEPTLKLDTFRTRKKPEVMRPEKIPMLRE